MTIKQTQNYKKESSNHILSFKKDIEGKGNPWKELKPKYIVHSTFEIVLKIKAKEPLPKTNFYD